MTLNSWNKALCTVILALAAQFVAGAQEPRQVESRKNTTVEEWKSNPTLTLDRLKGFSLRKTDPATDEYGGWKAATYEATGFFRTQKIGERWWMIDPAGHPYIFKGVAVFSIGHSERPEDAMLLKKMVAETFPHLAEEPRIYPIGATIGCHTGPGTLTLFCFGKKRDF